MKLHELQTKQKEWFDRNELQSEPHTHLLDVTEEVGELAHAHLKYEQGLIRRGEYLKEATDAVGDITIMLAGYCNDNGLDFDSCVTNAWDAIKDRNVKAKYKPDSHVKSPDSIEDVKELMRGFCKDSTDCHNPDVLMHVTLNYYEADYIRYGNQFYKCAQEIIKEVTGTGTDTEAENGI